MCDVSIIIPTYKGGKSLLVSVLSAINQTIESKEIIVVDDNGRGSNEQIYTEKMLSEYINSGKIRYLVHEKNKNGSAARNTGVKNSKGDYVAFLDDDDYWFPTKIEKQLISLKGSNQQVGLCICSGFYVHLNGKGYVKKIGSKYISLTNYLTDKQYFNTSAILLKREVLNRLQGFDETFTRHQDWEFMVRALRSYKTTVVDEPLLIKYTVARNTPQNIDVTKNNLDYFFSKMGNIICSEVGCEDYSRIRKYKYQKICQLQIIQHNYAEFQKYIKEYDINIFSCAFDLIKHAVERYTSGNRKRTYSFSEVSDILGL